MKRIVVNKPSLKKCDICGKSISLYSFSGHLKWTHDSSADEYEKTYGTFRKSKITIKKRNIKKIKCGICNNEYASVGFYGHLRDSHDMSVEKYVNQFGEYRPSKLREIEYTDRLLGLNEEDKHVCLICGDQFASGKLLGGHIKKIHNLEKDKYIWEYVFKNEHPLCNCGCGKKVKLINYYPYKVEYVTGHNSVGVNNPMYGKSHDKLSVKKMSESAVERFSENPNIKTIDTEPELLFESILNKLGIKYKHPYIITKDDRDMSIDFYLTEHDMCVEIDGAYWHPDQLNGLNFKLLSSVISDKQKNDAVKNLYRIRSDDLNNVIDKSTDKETLIQNIKQYNKINDLSLKYDDVVIQKDYFKNSIDSKGKPYVESFVWLLKKFIKNFHPDFPYPLLNEDLNVVLSSIHNYTFDRIYDGNVRTFSNNISTIGHNYLKHIFRSYWKSKYKHNMSPIEAWSNESIMNEVIKYRIGCNNSNEIFDFSLRNLINGLSARRTTVSFFKPLLAAAIYKHYLGDNQTPMVLDPCCGFGGRLLGFKSMYPNGIYIGCEPNIETYNELLQLKENAGWNDLHVQIYNSKFEDFKDENYNYDLIFTSIPYYDLELYSNNMEYQSFDHWKNTFIKSFERYRGKNCYINISEELATKLDMKHIDAYIASNRSHFDSNVGLKNELIVKI
jgi:hypothetical protein